MIESQVTHYVNCDVCGKGDYVDDTVHGPWRHDHGWDVCHDCTPAGIQAKYDTFTRLTSYHYFTLWGVDPDRAAAFAVDMLDAGEYPPAVPPPDLMPAVVST